jgi:hypothetical protein
MSGVWGCDGKRIPRTLTYLLKCPDSSVPSGGVQSDDERLGCHQSTTTTTLTTTTTERVRRWTGTAGGMTSQLMGRAMTINVTTNPNAEGDGDGGDDGEQEGRRVRCECAFEGALQIKVRREERARARQERQGG